MAGQVVGLKRQYEDTTGLHNFDDRLTPRTRAELERYGSGASQSTAAGASSTNQRAILDMVRQNGHTFQRQPDGQYKAID